MIIVAMVVAALILLGVGFYRAMTRERDGRIIILMAALWLGLTAQIGLLGRQSDCKPPDQPKVVVGAPDSKKVEQLSDQNTCLQYQLKKEIEQRALLEGQLKKCDEQLVLSQGRLKKDAEQKDAGRNESLTAIKKQLDEIQRKQEDCQKPNSELLAVQQMQEQLKKIQDGLAKSGPVFPLPAIGKSKEVKLILKNNTIETVKAWDALCTAAAAAIRQQYNLPEDKNYSLHTTIDSMRFWLEERPAPKEK